LLPSPLCPGCWQYCCPCCHLTFGAMGGDGGQVIDRGTMVKTKGWGFTKSAGDRYSNSLGEMANYVQMISEDRGLGPLERHRVRMSQCWLSQEQLRDPVVVCRLGNLYNKEAIIGALLSKSIPAEIGHIRSLKDVKQCLITWKGAESEEGRRRMVCPVSREDLDTGGARAVVIWASGAVISVKSLKEMKLRECPVSNKAFDPDKDVYPLAPDKDELEGLRERLPAARTKRKAAAMSAEEPSKVECAKEACKTDGPQGSKVFKSLFNEDLGDGLTGNRDAFGTPAYNKGTRLV